MALISSISANDLVKELNGLFANVAEKGKPSVVSIISEKSIKQQVHPFFFSPFEENFPEFEQKKTLIAVYGKSTLEAAENKNLIVDIKVPTEESRSMSMGIENYLNK